MSADVEDGGDASLQGPEEGNWRDQMGGFQVHPKKFCPHVHNLPLDIPEPAKTIMLEEVLKCSVEENCSAEDGPYSNIWVCCTCLRSFCGRGANGHGIAHAKETGHVQLLGMDDLSVWCYGQDDGCSGCDSYLDAFHITELHPVFTWAYRLKFNNEEPSFPRSAQRQNGNDHAAVVETLFTEQMFSLTLEVVQPQGETEGGGQEEKK